MAPSDKEPVDPGANLSNRSNPNDHIPSSQDQILLEALQQFIIPHVGTVVDALGGKERSQSLGPEAMNLITAFKEFISSVVRSSESNEATGGTMIEASLVEEILESELGKDLDVNAGDSGQEFEENMLNIGDDIFSNYSTPAQDPEPPFHEHVLRGLRTHVFNKMPLRLLRFAPQGSHLQITLAEKGAIYKDLVSIMEAHRDDPDYQRNWSESYDEAVARIIRKYAGYAILSHTWLRGAALEVTYGNWTKGLFDVSDPGYQKLVNFCKVAWKDHKLTLGWMDTVCINKESSSELDESIRSMYSWYQRSEVCIVHLAETQAIADIHLDPWFTRGWTLQELVAPTRVKFYNQHWKRFIRHGSNNDKALFGPQKIKLQISKATSITEDELYNIFGTSLSRRMQLAASREVTREEDVAYSLMGIFDVSIVTAYGEGAQRAFSRLLQEILNSTSKGILDLFNCAGEISDAVWRTSKILPSSPKGYDLRSSVVSNDSLHLMRPLAPLALTHLGLHIPVVLMPGIFVDNQETQHNPIGDYSARTIIAFRRHGAHKFTMSAFRLLDNRALSDANTGGAKTTYTAAVFNLQQGNRGILIPQTCIAKLLECGEPAGQVTSTGNYRSVETEMPLVFKMASRGPRPSAGEHGPGFWIREDKLAAHGMQFISLYL